ncbi:MAG TPA: hypothetical protein VFP53_09725 [Sphingomicrobium sp.]|nr:hypothetical protein [Sphingomicrobium sp.]
MIVLLSASAIYLAGLQAGINAPRTAFTQCLKSATSKAESSKVGGDAIEAYIRTNCSAEIDAFKSASVSFDVKNGVSKKEATAGADDMISGWLESSIDNYKFRAAEEAPPPQQAAAPAAPPASAPTQAASVEPAASAQ